MDHTFTLYTFEDTCRSLPWLVRSRPCSVRGPLFQASPSTYSKSLFGVNPRLRSILLSCLPDLAPQLGPLSPSQRLRRLVHFEKLVIFWFSSGRPGRGMTQYLPEQLDFLACEHLGPRYYSSGTWRPERRGVNGQPRSAPSGSLVDSRQQCNRQAVRPLLCYRQVDRDVRGRLGSSKNLNYTMRKDVLLFRWPKIAALSLPDSINPQIQGAYNAL